ncbi:MAG: metal ABC transporter substrate-binding protein [Planctomycetota bacterium]
MRKVILVVIMIIVGGFNLPQAKTKNPEIIVTLPAIKFIVDRITGDEKLTMALVKENTNPHFYDAKLSAIVKLKNARLFILMQTDFEVYVEALLASANNPQIVRGARGYLELANYVEIIEIPSNIERTGGELHAQGNPHFLLNPYNFRKAAIAIFSKLKEFYPDNEEKFKENVDKLLEELDTILFGKEISKSEMLYKRWLLDKLEKYLEEKGVKNNWTGITRKLSEIKNEKIIAYHKSFSYFLNFFKLNEFAIIEPKPGIPPSTSYLISLIDKINKENVKIILIEPYYPLKTANFLKEKAKNPLCVIISSTNVYNYFEWIKTTVENIYKAVKEGKCE